MNSLIVRVVRPNQQLKLFQKLDSDHKVGAQIAANKLKEAPVLLSAESAPYVIPMRQNILFRLQREIRNKIYAYVFGTTPLILKSLGLLILTTCGNPKSGY
jgi:hypothetical protein